MVYDIETYRLLAPAHIKILEDDIKNFQMLIEKEQSITPSNTLYIEKYEEQIAVNEYCIKLLKEKSSLT